jgi:hypothetical protein
MIEPPRNAREDLTMVADESYVKRTVEAPATESRLGRTLSVCWMVAVLLGFLVIRVIGSASFQSFHLIWKAR